MAITVYWACAEKEWMRASAPTSVLKSYYSKFPHKDDNPLMSINRCPSFNGYLTNLYELHSIYTYGFKIENNEIITDFYDQSFSQDHLLVRSFTDKWFSFIQKYVFFTDSSSLLMTAYEYPNYENNNITKNCHTIPGQYDIGRWFRALEFPFFLRDGSNEFNIELDEVYSYIRFHTDEKIKFVQFCMTDKLMSFLNAGRDLNVNRVRESISLEYVYSKFKAKNLIIKEIKNNLIQDI